MLWESESRRGGGGEEAKKEAPVFEISILKERRRLLVSFKRGLLLYFFQAGPPFVPFKIYLF